MSSFVYAAYKIVKIAVYPLSWILLLLVLALFGLWRGRRRLLQTCLVAALVLTYGLSLPPVARTLARTLEHRYPEPARIEKPPAKPWYDAVVVLAGGVSRRGGLRAEDQLQPASLERLLCGRSLVTQGLAPVLVLSGGNADPFADYTPEAEIMARTLQTFGPSPATIEIESRSRTTYENAVETKKLLGARVRIALVTSALHMPRAMALFKQHGFEPAAFPCGYLAGARESGIKEYLPDIRNLHHSTRAINEWVGLWLYDLAGKAASD
ncbi:MAG: YdcF family protein [Nitrospirota bacterium]